ncbi:MAG: sulfotransferase family protein [Phycisphaerae bacterium]
MAEKRVIVVLGMHHSGTSVIARSLAVFNIYLGDDLMPGQVDHPSGFWEDNRITAANDRILIAEGFSWRTPGFNCAKMKQNPRYPQTVRGIAEDLRRRFGSAPIWGFKDPRTCRMVPLWKDIFTKVGVQASYIVVVRNPRSVAESLRAKYGMTLRLGYTLWLEHLAMAVRETRRAQRVFVSYDRMLDDPRRELRREAAALNLDESTLQTAAARVFVCSFLDRKLRHRYHDPGKVPRPARWESVYHHAYGLLGAVAADEISDTEFQKAWQAVVPLRGLA